MSQVVNRHHDQLGSALAAGRVGIGVLFWLRPRLAVRLAGTDGFTAGRVTFLARMLAARDLALGVGGVLAHARPAGDRVPWLLAGAAVDAADCLLIADGIRRGRLRPVPAALTSAGAGATAAAGVLAAVWELRPPADRTARMAQPKSSSG